MLMSDFLLNHVLIQICETEQSNFARTLTQLGDSSEISASLARISAKDQATRKRFSRMESENPRQGGSGFVLKYAGSRADSRSTATRKSGGLTRI